MAAKKHPAALSFTGGKDCMLALAEVLSGADIEICLLVTFGPAAAFEEEEEEEEEGGGDGASGAHGDGKKKKGFLAHPLPVIRAQARALGLPHLPVPIDGSGDGGYQGAYQAALRALRMGPHGITHLVTGDILDVCNGFMEKAAVNADCTLIRPLWQQPRKALLAKMAPFNFLLSCCSVEKMGPHKAREYVGLMGAAAYGRLCALAERNERPEAEAEAEAEERSVVIDACGEHGEFHSMVLDAPFFRAGRLAFDDGGGDGGGNDVAEKPPIRETEDGKFLYCDLGRLVFVAKD